MILWVGQVVLVAWASSAGAGWSRTASLTCLTIDKLVGLEGVSWGVGEVAHFYAISKLVTK